MLKTAESQTAAFDTNQRGFKFTVNLSTDLMTGNLAVIQSDKDASFNFTADDLIAILGQAGIVNGIKHEALAQIVTGGPPKNRIEIARGVSPERGRDAGYEVLFETSRGRTPAVGPGGLIDYKNLNLIRNARTGQALARKIHATMGKAGMTVTGVEVEGLPGKDRALPKGKNTQISTEDPDVLVAADSGAILYSNNVISIEKVYKLPNDVDISTGNLNHTGNLQIGGGIKTGFTVNADGNIEIGKNVEDAAVVSGGSIVISGGFIGSGNGKVQARDDVFAKFIENGRVEAGNDIHVGGVALNSHLEAGNAIHLKGARAVILGGLATAFNLIETDSIGAELGTKTTVRVGYNPAILKEMQDTEAEIKRLKSDFERVKQALYSLVRLEMDNKLSQLQIDSLSRLKSCRDEIPNHIEQLEKRKQELLNELSENKGAKIVVRGTAYRGTIIQIGKLKKELVKDVSNCAFMAEHDQIIIISHR
jgi:uncharacterized protein